MGERGGENEQQFDQFEQSIHVLLRGMRRLKGVELVREVTGGGNESEFPE